MNDTTYYPPCIVCRKIIRTADPEMVLYRTDGRMFATEHADQVPAAQDQGWFEIGPDCARKVRRAGAAGFAR